MRRPPCPAVIFVADGDGFRRFDCTRRRWHRSLLHSAALPLSDEETDPVSSVCWARDWAAPLSRALEVIQRWTAWPRIEPVDWNGR